MRRVGAIIRAAAAFGREHAEGEAFNHCQHQAICLIDALEALGVLKLDELEPYAFHTSSTEAGRAPEQKTGSHFRSQLTGERARGFYPGGPPRGLDHDEVESIINGLKPDEVLARVLLGAPFGQWLVGFGPNGADRLIQALKDAGFLIVKPAGLSLDTAGIEITPDMEREGALSIQNLTDCTYSMAKDVARELFLAMLSKNPKFQHLTQHLANEEDR